MSVRVWISSSINQEKNDNPKQYSSYEKLLLLMNSVTSLEGVGKTRKYCGLQGPRGFECFFLSKECYRTTEFSTELTLKASKNRNLVLNQRRERDLNLWPLDEGSP